MSQAVSKSDTLIDMLVFHNCQSCNILRPQPEKPNMSEASICKHDILVHEFCQGCNQFIETDHGIRFSYIQKGLKLNDDTVEKLRKQISEELFGQKQLQLVLDLDHTLLHSTTQLPDLNEYRSMQPPCQELYTTNKSLVKLRPFVHDFLKEASTMFQLYVSTMGSFYHANRVVSLLDPEGTYFGRRIITHKDTPKHKTLDLVLGQKRGIVIVDDLKRVWPHDQENLIQIKRYDYFPDECGNELKKSFYEKRSDESENDGELAKTLMVLKKIHKLFFDTKVPNPDSRDVRLILPQLELVPKESLSFTELLQLIKSPSTTNRHSASEFTLISPTK